MEKIDENRNYLPTTFDNPNNPWTNYDEWEAFDRHFGYKTWEKIATISMNSTKITEFEDEEATKYAIDELCELMPGLYTRVYEPVEHREGV